MSRRGRPKATEEAARRQVVIEAAIAELIEKGVHKTTMLGIAQRASASKETLYAWFGNKSGLFAALIAYQAEGIVTRVRQALDRGETAQETLSAFGVGFLQLLLGEPSISLNRAAMTAPDLAADLLQGGRFQAGPIVEAYLAQLHANGRYHIPDPPAAFQQLYGLLVQDWQIRVLLGDPPPAQATLSAHVEEAVRIFLQIHTPPESN